ncbi:hypothetical protein NW762_009042 [Fusarium torreyae]|uniref:Uncharacterized protein n=1 Tax=Fusarium torreyae TaxID=1237075 RepID=A0A9W8RXQ1_9HYPO|nr:hypothetical protein NW762_009042 [Fusarium torreyae]
MSYREECREEGLMDVLEDVQHIASKLWQVVEDVRNVFEDPTLVDEPGAAYLIANLESWLKTKKVFLDGWSSLIPMIGTL